MLKITDDNKKNIVIYIGLIILVFLHALNLLVAYWAIKYSVWDAFILAVLLMVISDLVGIGILLVKDIFKITPKDMDKITIDDAPK